MPDPVEVSPASDRGQVGIGTLVVFIAMVLVAAIAAGVLLDTAGFLQSKSEVVGQESSEQVTDRLQVVSTIGHVSSASEQVTVKVYNETHLKLAGWDKEDGSKSSITVEEGKPVYLQGIGIESGETTDFIFGDRSITFTFDELTTTNPNNHAKVRFEVLDGGEVRLYDELEGRAVGVVDGPVRVQASPGETLLFGTQMGQFDYKIGNAGDSDPANPPAGSSYVLNHTEQRDRSGPLDVVENVSITVRPSSGSSQIDLTEATITYVSDHETARLTHTDGEPTGTTFATTVLKGSDSVVATDEQATIRLNSTLIGDTDTSLRPGESVQLNIVTQSGASTTVRFTVPRTLTGETAVSL